MTSWLLLASGFWQADLWYALPLILVVSLVYGATRHEQMMPILAHALRAGAWIAGFMAIIFALLFGVSLLV